MSDGLQILWLKTGPLHPVDTGGKIRTYNMLKELGRRHRLTYLSLWPGGTIATARRDAAEYSHEQIWVPWSETRKGSLKFYCELMANFVFGHLPYAIAKYQYAGWKHAMADADRSGMFHLIVCDFLTPAVNLFPGGRRPKTPVLLFQHNVESLIWKRHYETTEGAFRRRYIRNQWHRMERFEREACALASKVCAVSEEDAQLLRRALGLTNVCGAVPTGVDLDYFQASTAPRQPHSLVFLGSMDWMPNIDGACWFADKVWPLVKQKFPDATLTIVGRNPTTRVEDLAARDDAIRVTGTVPDVRPHLAQASAMVIPLRVGGGTRIKIFEAMATGIPCVSTHIGAEGLPVKHGEHIALADSPAEFVREISALFNDAELRQRLGQNARALVESQYGWGPVTDEFEEFCLETAALGN